MGLNDKSLGPTRDRTWHKFNVYDTRLLNWSGRILITSPHTSPVTHSFLILLPLITTLKKSSIFLHPPLIPLPFFLPQEDGLQEKISHRCLHLRWLHPQPAPVASPPHPWAGHGLPRHFLVLQLRVRRGDGRGADGMDPTSNPSGPHPPSQVAVLVREPGELPRVGSPPEELPPSALRGQLPMGCRCRDRAPPSSGAVPVFHPWELVCLNTVYYLFLHDLSQVHNLMYLFLRFIILYTYFNLLHDAKKFRARLRHLL